MLLGGWGKDDVSLSLVGLIWSSLQEKHGTMAWGGVDSMG